MEPVDVEGLGLNDYYEVMLNVIISIYIYDQLIWFFVPKIILGSPPPFGF